MTVGIIVVGTDGSEGAATAVTWVADLAGQTGARVAAVHCFEPLARLADLSPQVDLAGLLSETKNALETVWCRPLSDAGIRYEALLREGDPTQALLDVADDLDADLIAVGARGLGAVKGLLVGSTSVKLIHLSRRPVVIVPRPREG